MDKNEITGLFSKLSHDINGQISTIRMKENMLKKIVPLLLRGYQEALQKGLIEGEVSESLIKNIDDLLNIDEQLVVISETLEKSRENIE